MAKYAKPLNRSISIGCVFFIVALCIFVSIVNYDAFRRALYGRYNAYLTDVLRYIESNIDQDDLRACTETTTKSEKFDELQELLNNIVDVCDVHYVYALRPLNTDEINNCMTIISGMTKEEIENEYDDLYFLGDIFYDDFPPETMKQFFSAMEKPGEISFEIDHEATSWGYDYTGILPLQDSTGTVYGVMCVDISVSEIYQMLLQHTIKSVLIIALVGVFFSVCFILWSKKHITQPIKLLEESVVDFAKTSHGQNDPQMLVYNEPDIHTANEVESLSQAVTQMSGDMKTYAENILAAEGKVSNLQKNVAELGTLAYQDALTHVKNKTAYDERLLQLNAKIEDKQAMFAIVMIDLNNLKHINDKYGHERGNTYITGSCQIVCEIYEHSPVFRIGGDEFVVLLENRDYKTRDALFEKICAVFAEQRNDSSKEPWKRFSAAVGMAVFDAQKDATADEVFKRADKAMYKNKILVKGSAAR